MNATVANLSLLAGVALVGAGCGMTFGAPAALMTVGALVIGLTLAIANMSRKG